MARVLGGDVTGEAAGCPWMAVEHLEGRDLGEVYAELSSSQNAALARDVVQIQQLVAELGEGDGFGYAFGASNAAPFACWAEVIDRLIERSMGWLAETGLDAAEEALLVHRGGLSGTVDVDELCYGDRMLWVGLTRMALLNAGHDDEYAEDLLDELGADRNDRAQCEFYTGLFAFVFLSELGVAFNGEASRAGPRKATFLRCAVREWLV